MTSIKKALADARVIAVAKVLVRISYLLSAVIVSLILCSNAWGRTVDWSTELTADLLLATAAYAIERNKPESATYNDEEFPTQSYDDHMARQIHGEPTGDDATEKERFYREASNVSVFTAGALPVVLGIGKGPENFAAKAMTVTHSLLLSNFIVTTAKYSVGRARPKARQNEALAHGDNALSFPSGHASAAFAGATLVSLLYPDQPWWTKASGYTLAAFTAWARIAGDKHFFVDVVAGGLIGVGSALATVTLVEREDNSNLSLVLESESVGFTYSF